MKIHPGPRRLAAGTLAAALAITLAACADKPGSAASGPPPAAAPAAVDYNPQPYDNVKDGGTLRVPGSVIEQGNTFHADANLSAARFWFWYNADAITYSPTGEVQYNPDYYSNVKVEVVGGNQKVTIDLNPKAVFNDGTPIDYRALEATWKADNGSDKDYYASDTIPYAKITSVHAGTSDKQAVIEYKGVNPWWTAQWLTFMHPKAAADAKTFNTAYLSKVQPQWGAGPYVVTQYDAKTGDATFERNPKWWGKRGKLDKRIIVGLDPQAAINAFRNGELDYASTGTADQFKQISGVRGTQVRKGGSPFEYFLFLNSKAPLLKDPAVRKALLESIDRPQIASIWLQGLDYKEPLPGSALYYSFQKGYHDNVSEVIKFDPETAKKELDAAGWKPGADGVREKDGQRLELGYTFTGDDPLDKATAGAVAKQLAPIGIKVTARPTSEQEFDSVVSGRKFDLFLAGNRSLDPFGARYLDGFYGSTSNENLTGVGTPELDQEIKDAANIADPAKQIEKANEIERKGLALYGFIPLYSGPSIYGVSQGLANIGATIFATPLPETVGWQK
ncbi:ABC transporter family substrate-binding protein [Labedaea rhizosphaerae]|uniref:Peptide/nickel transport system substrate-binding protein n=1 Tax=Labedaea rhizosphaerae TaxID=598644 RepID=A0A4R6SF68_LABRH|nr:ABC transporter family substrate-binding protein [Labedaea rhizosphaerae]TDQ00255.1 peptide/nickel transport system substrate-binding protein [Labedaea rhizosphaerae]